MMWETQPMSCKGTLPASNKNPLDEDQIQNNYTASVGPDAGSCTSTFCVNLTHLPFK